MAINVPPNPTPITLLPSGTAALTDVYMAVDTTDQTESSSGTTKKYTISQLADLIDTSIVSNIKSAVVATTVDLDATYSSGSDVNHPGVGATLTNAGALGALIVDGVTLALNDRVLVKDQTDDAENGVYYLSTLGTGSVAWILTRATDYDDNVSNEIELGDFIIVSRGTIQFLTLWIQTEDTPLPSQIGTAPINFELQDISSFGGILSLSHGGTNAALVASNGGIVYSGATAFAVLSGTVTAGKVLQSGSSAAPSWSTPTYPSTSGTSGKILVSDGTNIVYSTPSFPITVGSTGTIIRSNGTDWVATTTTWPNTTTANRILYSSSTNTVSEITSANSATLYTNSSGVPAFTSSMTNGQLLIGSTGASPVLGTLTAGNTLVTITNAAGSITLTPASRGLLTQNLNVPTFNLLVNTKVKGNLGTPQTFTLPATSTVGDVIMIIQQGAGNITIAQRAGQSITSIAGTTTVGTGGSLTSQYQYCGIELVCSVTDTTWQVSFVTGDWTGV